MKRLIAYAIGLFLLWLVLALVFPGCVMVNRFYNSDPVPLTGNSADVYRERGKYNIVDHFRKNDAGKWYLEKTDTLEVVK